MDAILRMTGAVSRAPASPLSFRREVVPTWLGALGSVHRVCETFRREVFMPSILRRFGLPVCLAFALSLVASAQQRTVTTADLQQLQDGVTSASTEVSQVRTRDAAKAAQLERDLDVLREDITYLRVVFRREGRVAQADFDAAQRRLTTLRQDARSSLGITTSAPQAGPNDLPVGTEFDVRLGSPLSSDTAKVEDRFEATTVLNVDNAERVLVPAGTVLKGFVVAVESAGRVNRTGRLTLGFETITVRGRDYPMRGVVTQVLESDGIRGEKGRIGAGAGIGAVIGGLLGGFKGAVAGILVGGGGAIAATEGKDVSVPAGTILRVRLDSPLSLQ